ncbi:DUF2905 family protein [Noviherbaspirillum autotrophicum]|uniref:DUF2905 domain-containing protein n=1 Tax=Noviherbaspirillum autotrophicum TaxID=709839 RepID=A0A0C2BJQ9_9BURK|nr:DUF2905 family protein [Noviherbaspirillum autotrophicum]KIF80249.1 hypothetical protein TSA66_04605 [Noviherbaspirillum autotrophicum]
MIRWVAAIFLGLSVFYPLLPGLEKLGVGRVPGDVRFRLRTIVFCLPFGSTVLWSALAFLIAQLLK